MERLFLGIPLTHAARDGLRERLPAELPGSPVPVENWHITLRFLGVVPVESRAELVAALRTMALPAPFTVELTGMGAFPSARRAKVVWVGAGTGAPELATLAATVERVATNAGFPAEPRRFHPHVTVARIRQPQDARQILIREWITPVVLPVTSLALFRSHLGAGPARYETLEILHLAE